MASRRGDSRNPGIGGGRMIIVGTILLLVLISLLLESNIRLPPRAPKRQRQRSFPKLTYWGLWALGILTLVIAVMVENIT